MATRFKRMMAAALAFIMLTVVIPFNPAAEAAEQTGGKRERSQEKTVNGGGTVKKEYGLQTASGRDGTYVKELNGIWLFGGQNLREEEALKADRSQWESIAVPHTWNATDAEDGGGNYLRTRYWYHKEMDITEEMLAKNIYIEFPGANTKTTVYVNGKKAGDTHKGGYTAFRYDITDKVRKGSNTLDVCVDNTYDQEIAPISGDFNIYGGIYCRVYLVAVDKVHVDLEGNGSSGLFLETGNMRSRTAPEDLGELNIKADIVNESSTAKEVTVIATVHGDNAPAPVEKKLTVPANGSTAFKEHCKVENPTLWEGIRYDRNSDDSKVGYQYTVSLEIKDGTKTIDRVEDKIGFRYFWIDTKNNGEGGEGFFLNGKKFPLRGVNRHSFLAKVGSAMTEEQHENDIEIMKELGVNTIRLCHYPQTDFFYDLCDANGMIVWTEIPVVNEIRTTDAFKNVTRQQLTELISQQYNRPSVVFWGLENEIGNGQEKVTEEDTAIIPGMRIHVVAEDKKTTSDYTVVSSNLCLNKPVTVSSSEAGNDGKNAVDGNSATKWTAVNGTYPQSIVIDLGKAYNLGDLTLDWDIRSGARYYRYIVQASEDGKDYTEVINRRDNTESKQMTESMQLIPARYIRVEVTGCNQAGWATLFEVRADGYTKEIRWIYWIRTKK